MDVVTLSSIEAGRPERRRAAETLLLVFLGTVVMLFAGFTSAAFIRRAGTDWETLRMPALAWANVLPLVLGSVALELARRRPAAHWTRVALGAGLVFLIGQVLVWSSLAGSGAVLSSTPAGAFFCLLLAVHALHLLGGIAALGIVAARSAAPRLVAVYWHFLGALWLYVLVFLRLV
jgi:cytochrome c oxidase subunit 3